MKRQSKLAAAGITGAMLIGAGAGVVLNLPSGAGATGASTATSVATSDSTTPTTDATPSTDAATPDTTGTDQGGRPGRGPRGALLKTELDALVTNGTITQAQEDAILAGIEAARPTPPTADQSGSPANPSGDGDGAGGPDFGGRHGGMGGRGPGFGGGRGGFGGGFGLAEGLDAAATALGVTSDELKTDLEAGKTIADIAKDKGVDVQKVIDAIVAVETTELTKLVTDAVNGVRPSPPAGAPDSSVPDTGDTTTTTG
ncbi:MAG: hypothetical protein JWL72_16 [Ilumatobacteraceae bacterium]|nr:hypothetical protein [Ilumatobacteraceae bacterium]